MRETPTKGNGENTHPSMAVVTRRPAPSLTSLLLYLNEQVTHKHSLNGGDNGGEFIYLTKLQKATYVKKIIIIILIIIMKLNILFEKQRQVKNNISVLLKFLNILFTIEHFFFFHLTSTHAVG